MNTAEKIKIIVVDKELQPFHGTDGSAGLDLRCDQDIVLRPGQIAKVGLGIKVELPNSHCGLLVPRSGGQLFVLTNTVGILDQDYQGNLIAKIRNVSNEDMLIQRGDRIVQLVVLPVVIPNAANVEFVESFDKVTTRGEGGFHSTGVK